MSSTMTFTSSEGAPHALPSQDAKQRVLPAGLDEAAFNNVCDLVANVIGEQNVSRTHESGGPEGPGGATWYGDHYEMRGAGRNTPAGAFRPQTIEEIQHIMKIANEHNVPLWVFSRGKNLGQVLRQSYLLNPRELT
jgi:hypothetical protein